MEKVTAKDLVEAADKIGSKPPEPLQCCMCGDSPDRLSLSGLYFCMSCFKDVYL
jgi:hypothetical protein